jgi:hypothetical protein
MVAPLLVGARYQRIYQQIFRIPAMLGGASRRTFAPKRLIFRAETKVGDGLRRVFWLPE